MPLTYSSVIAQIHVISQNENTLLIEFTLHCCFCAMSDVQSSLFWKFPKMFVVYSYRTPAHLIFL